MADVFDLELEQVTDGTTVDLKLASGDLSVVTQEYLVRQKLQVALWTFRGEWVFNINAGVPYLTNVFGPEKHPKEEIDAVLKAAIKGVEDVNTILAYESAFSAATRQLTVSFKVDTTFGPVEVEGITI